MHIYTYIFSYDVICSGKGKLEKNVSILDKRGLLCNIKKEKKIGKGRGGIKLRETFVRACFSLIFHSVRIRAIFENGKLLSCAFEHPFKNINEEDVRNQMI